MKVLVTGGTGFLGSYIVKELIKNKVDTIVYDKRWPKKIMDELSSSPYYTFIKGDVLNYNTLSDAMESCQIVIHAAAIANLDKARSLPIQTMQVNVIGTANCLEAARNIGVKRFIFASSVYTSGKWGSFYRVSKQAGESLCKTFHEEYGLEYTIVRYGSLYGRDANEWNPIYNLLKAILTTDEYSYISSKEAIREYIHISDAARETIRIATDPEFANKAVLVTGHQRMKIEDFFAMIKEIIGRDVKINYAPAEQHKHYVISPYSFEADVPIRVNMSSYVDISEGILDCLRQVQNDIDQQNQNNSSEN